MRTGRSAVLALLMVAGVVVTPGPAGATEAIDWQPCADAPEVQCATLEVPLDWSDPDGPTTYIGLARRPATDPEHRIGSILMNPGGPGGSGVNHVKRGPVFTAPVNERFDVVGFDPRGVGTSEQVLCDAEVFEEFIAAQHPTNEAEFDDLVAANHRLAASCREHTGPLVDHVDSVHAARDLDAIRAALGEEKLNYIGYSYGTLMGQHYAELFPDRIRTMINDGNVDHSIESGWEYARKSVTEAEEAFVAFADWCDTTATCALYGQDTRRVYGELKERARAGTLIDPSTGQPLDFYNLTLITIQTYRPEAWPQIATTFRTLHDGSGGMVAPHQAELTNGVFFVVRCSDWRLQVEDFAEYDRLRTRVANRFPNMEWTAYVDYMSHCVGDPVEVTNPQRPLEIEGAPPLVMIGNSHDPATPLSFSRTAARQSGSHLIIYEGWGHTAYYPGFQNSPCVNAAVEAYLIDLTVPPDGLTCPSVNDPESHSS